MIRLGMIGSGPIASKALEVLASLDHVTVAAVSSRRQAPRAALAKQFGIARQFDAANELLGEPLDGCAGAGDARRDREPSRPAALARDMPTFLEKPPGLTLREAEGLAELAEQRGVPNQVGLNRRFYSVMRAARAAIEASGHLFGIRIEAPEAIERARAAGRTDDVLRHWVAANSLHAIDLLRHFGGDVRARHRAEPRPIPVSTENSMAALSNLNRAQSVNTRHIGAARAMGCFGVRPRRIEAVLTPFERGVLPSRGRRTNSRLPSMKSMCDSGPAFTVSSRSSSAGCARVRKVRRLRRISRTRHARWSLPSGCQAACTE